MFMTIRRTEIDEGEAGDECTDNAHEIDVMPTDNACSACLYESVMIKMECIK